jgi:quinolinate synthase
MKWAFENGDKILFLPDQHLGRNTAVLSLGLKLDDCVLWNPWKKNGGLTDDQIRSAKVILWRGHCSVHGRFTVDNINQARQQLPGVQILVHPECQHDVVANADLVGSTEMIIKSITQSPAGSKWAVGTELNLVQRLANENPDKQVIFLDKTICYCSTMNRIDLPHLVWAMESLVSGRMVNQIQVENEVAKYAKVALERMLALP